MEAVRILSVPRCLWSTRSMSSLAHGPEMPCPDLAATRGQVRSTRRRTHGPDRSDGALKEQGRLGAPIVNRQSLPRFIRGTSNQELDL